MFIPLDPLAGGGGIESLGSLSGILAFLVVTVREILVQLQRRRIKRDIVRVQQEKDNPGNPGESNGSNKNNGASSLNLMLEMIKEQNERLRNLEISFAGLQARCSERHPEHRK